MYVTRFAGIEDEDEDEDEHEDEHDCELAAIKNQKSKIKNANASL
jgi:hypothetical protein